MGMLNFKQNINNFQKFLKGFWGKIFKFVLIFKNIIPNDINNSLEFSETSNFRKICTHESYF